MLISAEAGTVGDRSLANANHTSVARIKACDHFNFSAESVFRGGELACEYRATGCEGECKGFLEGHEFAFVSRLGIIA